MKGGTVMIVIWGSLLMLILILFIRLIIRERQKKMNSDDPDQLRYKWNNTTYTLACCLGMMTPCSRVTNILL